MKSLVLALSLIFTTILVYPATHLVDGNALLEFETDHSGITITMTRTAPTQLIEIFTTDGSGSFSGIVEEGIYDITYEKNGFISQSENDYPVFAPSTLPNASLETVGLIGEQSGTLTSGTYKVTGNISVVNGQSLTIEAGTTLRFATGVEFEIRGDLQAIGTVTDSITFESYNEQSSWNGIKQYGHMDLAFVNVLYSSESGITAYGSGTVFNSNISHNTADYSGGGVYLNGENSSVHWSNNIFSYNSAQQGGAIHIDIVTKHASNKVRPLITNCIFHHNLASSGAGISFRLQFHDYDLYPIISNCTFVQNVGTALETVTNGILPSISNCVIANNSGRGISFGGNGYHFVGYNCLFNNTGGNFENPPAFMGQDITTNANGHDCDAFKNIQLDPQFIDADNNDFRLLPQSPCIEAGLNDSTWTQTDFDLNDRIFDADKMNGAVVDMGAFEVNSIITSINSLGVIEELSVFPTLFTSEVNIRNPLEKDVLVQLFNPSGEKLLSTNASTLDLSHLKSGLYLLTVQSGSSSKQFKIYKQ